MKTEPNNLNYPEKHRKYSPSLKNKGGIILLVSIITLTAVTSGAAMIYQINHGGLCLLLSIFGVPCPGCGLTRATFSALRGELTLALSYHPMFWAPYLMIGIGLLSIPMKKLRRSAFVTVVILAFAMLSCWIIRLLCGWNGYLPT